MVRPRGQRAGAGVRRQDPVRTAPRLRPSDLRQGGVPPRRRQPSAVPAQRVRLVLGDRPGLTGRGRSGRVGCRRDVRARRVRWELQPKPPNSGNEFRSAAVPRVTALARVYPLAPEAVVGFAYRRTGRRVTEVPVFVQRVAEGLPEPSAPCPVRGVHRDARRCAGSAGHRARRGSRAISVRGAPRVAPITSTGLSKRPSRQRQNVSRRLISKRCTA